MTKDFMTLLFYNVSCDLNSICRKDHKLGNLYERIPEVDKLYDPLHDKLISLGVKSGLDAISAELDELGETREMQGFLNGFRLGMMLRDELRDEKDHA